MASALSCSMILPSLAVSQSTLDNILFDPVFYAAANPDVVQALGSSYAALMGHYDTYGKREGRAPSDMFDPHFYLESYPDLKAAFGNNYVAAYNHFVQHGISEGRAGSASFHVEVYKNNYSDLRNAFGTSSSDNWEYFRHFDDYGRQEGRTATSTPTSSGVTSTSSSSSPQTVTQYVKTSNPANSLNLRSGPSTSHSVLKKLSYGTAVQVLSTSGSWAQVNAGGTTGYVSTQYLSTSNPNTSGTSSTSTSSLQNMSYALYRTSGGRLTCGFNGYRSTSGYHEGIDFKRGYGSDVYSLTDGVITRVTQGSNGRKGLSTIAIYHAATDKTIVYLHTDPLDELYVGQTIQRGQKLGTEAWRGISSVSDTHTHVEVRNGRRTSAAISVGDYTLENENPTNFWNSQGYTVK